MLIAERQKGDTIVEVLISIAVVALVIAGAYALSSRSLRQGITASERTEALKIAETQIETLKFREQSASADDWKNRLLPPIKNSNFCFDETVTDKSQPGWLPLTNHGTDPTNLNISASNYDAKCVKNNSKYFVNITTVQSSVAGSSKVTYLVSVRWNAIGGGQNSSQLYYRL